MAIYDDLFKAPVEKKEGSNRSANTSDWAAEQKAAREEAYALADKTALSISENGKRFREYLDIQSRFENYSATNALLILAQLPKATSLKEKSSWIEAGHSINENATPISIIKPGKSYQRDDASYGNYYNVHLVYDISQTDAPVPAKPSVNYDERLIITALISKRPVPIELSDDIANGAVYDNEKKKIFVRKGMEGPDVFRSVSLALARAEMAQNKDGYTTETVAFKSYCVSYMLCKKYGIDVSGYDFSHMPEELKNTDEKARRAELNEIRDTFKAISSRMDRALEQNKSKDTKTQER